MTDNTEAANEPAVAVRVELNLPAGLVRAYDDLVEEGIYPSRESALLHAIVESWRHNRGSFYTVRLDFDCRDAKTDQGAEPSPQEGDGS